ncbi:MAG: hypothetical protein ACTSQ8_24090 [Candidatus Helarchaeota archaeon]
MQSTMRNENELFERIYDRMQPELLTPSVKLERSWTLNGGIVNHYMYLARPFPKFWLNALYECIKNYLELNDMPHNKTTVVGGRYHRYEAKKILELKRFRINPAFLSGNVKNAFSYRLVFRPSWAGFTAVFWTRAICVTAYKGYSLDEPVNFISSLLTSTLNYPKYVIFEAIRKGKVEALLKEHEQVRINNQRGWRIEL